MVDLSVMNWGFTTQIMVNNGDIMGALSWNNRDLTNEHQSNARLCSSLYNVYAFITVAFRNLLIDIRQNQLYKPVRITGRHTVNAGFTLQQFT
jgi:hypothetical protein